MLPFLKYPQLMKITEVMAEILRWNIDNKYFDYVFRDVIDNGRYLHFYLNQVTQVSQISVVYLSEAELPLVMVMNNKGDVEIFFNILIDHINTYLDAPHIYPNGILSKSLKDFKL